MTWGFCLEYTPVEPFRRTWGYLVQECNIPNAWERDTGDGEKYACWQPPWHFDAKLDDLPEECELIVLTPEDGSKLQGRESLVYFEHPENVVYYFGSDKKDLHLYHLEGKKFRSVYIPNCGFMHSHTAAAMVVYDRMMKQWR